MYFAYGETELSYLRQKDKRLGAVIDRVGHVQRAVDTELFSSVVHHIIGQQISTKAQATIWQRLQDALGEVNAETIRAAGVPMLQSLGMTFRKAEYMTDFAEKVAAGQFDLDAVAHMSDADAIRELSALKGIGVWTAEMILLFCLQRPDIFSYDDLAIQRGLRMVYHHRKVDRRLFEKYRRRFSPYCSVASLYLWAVAGGAIPEMRDYLPRPKTGGKGNAEMVVLFEVKPTTAGMQRYLDLAAVLKPLLSGLEGFTWSGRFTSLCADGKLLSMSIWTDEAAVERWRGVVRHRMSQKEGREQLFESCRITACSELRTYTMTDRVQAPQDSNVFLRCKS